VLVITRVTADPATMPELLEIAEDTAPVFAHQPGFVASEIFKSTDDTRLITLLRWRSEKDHQACMESPDFEAANGRFGRLLESGRITFEVHVLERVGTIEATHGA
jgi:heme-degrading monooxygenase HmoA